MCHILLSDLTSDDFVVAAGMFAAPNALRRFLLRRPEIADIRNGLRDGAITEATIRDFVATLMKDFQPGKRFENELALAALAVALEKRPTDFAEEFLLDLAKLKLAEIPLCIRVARECLKQRIFVSQNIYRVFSVLRPMPSQIKTILVVSASPKITLRSQNICQVFDLRENYAKA
jgi:hypothetical protein